jgi:hypothetical protein
VDIESYSQIGNNNLIIPFVRKQLLTGGQRTVSALLKYTIKAADPNYYFMADFVLQLMMAARGKVAKL